MDPRLFSLLFFFLQLTLCYSYPFVIVPLVTSSVEGEGRHKRAFDRIEEGDFGLMKRSVPLKRAFDRLDFNDFSMRKKRAFDRLDFNDFSMRRKRAFDRLEDSSFGLYKRSVPTDEDSREALIHELASSIRHLRNVNAEDSR